MYYNSDYFETNKGNYAYQKSELVKSKYLNTLFKIKEHDVVLDIGCGYGVFLKECYRQAKQCVGIDISEHAILKAKELHPKIEFYVNDIQKGISYNNNFFDVVSMFDVIEHLEEPIKALREIHRILKLEGKFVITTPNAAGIERIINKNGWSGAKDKSHLLLYTPYSLKFLLERIGFKVIDIRTPFHTVPVIGRLLEPTGLGGQILALCEKRR